MSITTWICPNCHSEEIYNEKIICSKCGWNPPFRVDMGIGTVSLPLFIIGDFKW